MAVYTTTKCGSCGAKWEDDSVRVFSSVGPPLVKCKACNINNKTSLKLYRDMSTFDRLFFWLGQGAYCFVFGPLGLGSAISIAFYTDFNIFLRIIISIILGCLGILVFFNLFTKPQQIKDMEELFDKNGGFLWSNEQY